MNTKLIIGDLIPKLEEVRDLLTVDDNVQEPIADAQEKKEIVFNHVEDSIKKVEDIIVNTEERDFRIMAGLLNSIESIDKKCTILDCLSIAYEYKMIFDDPITNNNAKKKLEGELEKILLKLNNNFKIDRIDWAVVKTYIDTKK